MTPRRELAISIVLSMLALLVGAATLAYATGCAEDEGCPPRPAAEDLRPPDIVEILECECLEHEWDDKAFAECVGYGLTDHETSAALTRYHSGLPQYEAIENLASDLFYWIEWLEGEQ